MPISKTTNPDSLEQLLRAALTSFANDLKGTHWPGKEREAVSLFAMGYLVPRCAAGARLHDPRQIGIEVRVPQISTGAKDQVCKDLIIWPEPGMTCWNKDGNPQNIPLCVMEWKWGTKSFCNDDLDWLSEFTRLHSSCEGYAICYNPPPAKPIIRCARVANGEVDREWLIA